MEKVQGTTHGSCCFAPCIPAGQSVSSTPASTPVSRVLRFGAVALLVGAVFMLCASVAALYLWKVNDRNVYNVRYSLNIDGEVKEGSMEIDSDNNLERFKTGSGAVEAVEIHDFQIGITGIRFFGGDKCYIKPQIKANLQLMGAHNKKTLMFDLTDEIMPVRYDAGFLIWVAAEQPLRDTTFLSHKILDLCGERPIFWLQPMYPKDGERRKRDIQRAKRQAEDEEESAAGSAYNPENPYHRSGEAREESAMTFDTMLDHQGICCSECQRSYTHCQRVCEPLRGYWPWPYNYRGCQVACRVIMPCRWWVARILGLV
ncbi:leukocyte cell-derived chemotaxin 1 [Odontesthes bonariensis]|uniref:leukocyte cell-derived chemotaxin 1 n=1 Tax=Odontesthes bonariensis TaxID=219752 RepID=UPI003F5860F7